jgi:hypothetical protein
MLACCGCPRAHGMVHDALEQALAVPLSGFNKIREEDTS